MQGDNPTIESPDAFQTASPSAYHLAALETLRKYVRLLGNALSDKSSDARLESAKAYIHFAEQEYCEDQPLVPKADRDQVLATLSSRR